MNYLRGAFADAKLRHRVNKTVGDATATPSPGNYALCVALADDHPMSILGAIKDRTTYSHPDTTYKALTLLEHLVGACNYSFHEALAQHVGLQDKILQLAVRRVEDDAHRRVQRLCRLTLLEYSRMFADDKALMRLSTLAKQFEKRTHKNLLRCLNIQTKHVAFRDVSTQDVVTLNPTEGTLSGVPAGVKDLAPLKFSHAEVWLCHVCGYMNSPAAARCAACETARTTGDTPPRTPKNAANPCAGERPDTATDGTAAAAVVGASVVAHTGSAGLASRHCSSSIPVRGVLADSAAAERLRNESQLHQWAEEDGDLTSGVIPAPAATTDASHHSNSHGDPPPSLSTGAPQPRKNEDATEAAVADTAKDDSAVDANGVGAGTEKVAALEEPTADEEDLK